MHLYDVIVVAVLVLLAFRGARRGLVRELAALAGLALGYLLAYRLDGSLGRRLESAVPSLTPTEARALAFLAVVLVAAIAVDVAARFVTALIRHVPVVGGLNRLGGLLTGALLAFLCVWLLTTCLLLLPASLVPSMAGVRHSQTARLLHSVPMQWSGGLRDHLERLASVPKGD